jgi:hypothetical protein
MLPAVLVWLAWSNPARPTFRHVGDETRALTLVLSGGGQSHEADCCVQVIGLVVPHKALGLGVHIVGRAYSRAVITAVCGQSGGVEEGQGSGRR